jgi:UDP-2,3-diacylglucosamine hydrolase
MPPKLGILAGGGTLPAKIIAACQASGRPFFVIAFQAQTDAATVADVPHAWVKLGAVGDSLAALRKEGVEELVFAGPVKRPSLNHFNLDMSALKMLAKIGPRAFFGDDGLLAGIVRELEHEGFRVLGVNDVLGDLAMPRGPCGQHRPDEMAQADIARGVAVARALGALDVGQAVVVQNGVVLGVEAIEGTDQLLARCAGLRRDGTGGVLVKLAKPGQERRVDLPTIGVETIARAAQAGLRGIAAEAGGTLIVDRGAVIAAADAAGLFVVGIDPTP